MIPLKKLVIILRGLEDSIGITGDYPPILQDINFVREAFSSTIPHPLIFCLPDYAITRFVKFAPDFWAWKSGVFDFKSVPSFKSAPMTKNIVIEHLFGKQREKHENIDNLHRFLTENTPSDEQQNSLRFRLRLTILSQLGTAYRNVGNNLEALEYLKKALKLVNLDESLIQPKAALLHELGIVYVTLEQFDAAIASFQQALEIRQRINDSQGQADTLHHKAQAYVYKGALEKAMFLFQQALTISQEIKDIQGEAATLHNMAKLYASQSQYETAIANYEKLLQIYTRQTFPENWAMTVNNLAIAYSERTLGQKAENLEYAIDYYHQALQVYTREAFPQPWAITQNNLGNAYSERILGDRSANLEQAIHCYQQALQVHTRDIFPKAWATTLNNLGTAYQNRLLGKRADNLEQAIDCYQQTLQVYTRDTFPSERATTLKNLGTAYQNRLLGERVENLEQAIHCYQQALHIHTREAFPQNYANTQFNLGTTYQQNNQLPLAHDSFAKAIETIEFLRGEIVSGEMVEFLHDEKVSEEQVKQELAADWNTFYQSMVEVCLALDKPIEAIEYVERSKTNPLAEHLANRELVELQQLQQKIADEKHRLAVTTKPDYSRITQLRQRYNELNPLSHLNFKQIQGLVDENTVILEWYITSDTFQTFIMSSHRPYLNIWQSSQDKLLALMTWAEEYLNSYYQIGQSGWRSQLNHRFRQLSEIIQLDDIISLIQQANEQCSQLILIPHQFLHLFPLHALPLVDGECLLDKFDSVRYAPSCQVLQQVQKQQRPNFRNCFAVQNPTNDLSYADLEVEIISSFFPTAQILTKQAATKAALYDNHDLSFAHCVHFACHSYFNLEFPLESALILANGERLTLADIFKLRLNQCRLVTLSAGETGLTGFRSPNHEYISLSSSFLSAGCASVVSSLWKINQVSTAFLMIKFYQNLMKNQSSVAKALNNAQRWLRDATPQQLLDWVNQLNLDEDKMTQIEDQLDWYNPDDKPYNDPYHWAAFCAIGQ